jgi:hypothetical protein
MGYDEVILGDVNSLQELLDNTYRSPPLSNTMPLLQSPSPSYSHSLPIEGGYFANMNTTHSPLQFTQPMQSNNSSLSSNYFPGFMNQDFQSQNSFSSINGTMYPMMNFEIPNTGSFQIGDSHYPRPNSIPDYLHYRSQSPSMASFSKAAEIKRPRSRNRNSTKKDNSNRRLKDIPDSQIFVFKNAFVPSARKDEAKVMQKSQSMPGMLEKSQSMPGRLANKASTNVASPLMSSHSFEALAHPTPKKFSLSPSLGTLSFNDGLNFNSDDGLFPFDLSGNQNDMPLLLLKGFDY